MKYKNNLVFAVDALFVAFLIWHFVGDPENYIWAALLAWLFLRQTFTRDF